MADNVTLNSGSGGSVCAADDIGSVFYQRVKPQVGADGAATDIIPVSNGMDAAATGIQASGIVGQFDDAATGAVTENQWAPVRISSRRALLVEGVASGTAVPVSVASGGIASGAVASGAIASGAVASGAVASGAFASGALAAGSIAAGAIADMIVDDAAFTPATSRVLMAGFEADEGSTDSVDEGDGGAARMTLDRKVIVTQQPHTAGGLSIFRSIDLDETEEEAKGTAGCVYGMWVTNTATATRWVKFYNATAANVSVGTTTPVITIGIPGNSSDDIAGAFGPNGIGITFDTAITLAATTGVADSDTGAPGANEVIVNLFYK